MINAKTAAIDIARSERDALTQKAGAIQKAGKEAEENLQTRRTEHQGKTSQIEEYQGQRAGPQQDVQSAEKRYQVGIGFTTGDEMLISLSYRMHNNNSRSVITKPPLRVTKSKKQEHLDPRIGLKDRYSVVRSVSRAVVRFMGGTSWHFGHHRWDSNKCSNASNTSALITSVTATSMVLEKIPAENGMKKIHTPENAPRLFDLIKSKEARFAPTFYKALRDTLVAEDLDQANRVAYGATRWRVVTLAGRMFETPGTMSGGMDNPHRVRDSEDATRKLNQVMEEATQAESEFERLRRLGPGLDTALQKPGLGIETGKRSITGAERCVGDLWAQNKPNQGGLRRISVLDAGIESTVTELEQLSEKSGKIEQGIKVLERRILEIGGSRLLGQKFKVDGIRYEDSFDYATSTDAA
ncbi:hypothetical protein Agabi119p4_10729 [Agaricus bisporus var. burnettii]|uniref:SMC hinge domain-containing protein n=1 Tax=Agaricus bisporus var. burnettii TaxID=192524 RepID=A0A8H7EX78_AGABI|nr:hypothetical protein Agabi119p4_10729 [Agaricus bisporus var. burnettii]